MSDPIPRPDEDFDVFAINLNSKLSSDTAGYGITVADVIPLSAAIALWTSAYAADLANAPVAASLAAAKNTARENATIPMRLLINKIQANPAVTDAKRALANITIRDTTRSVIPPPSTAPIGQVDTSQRFHHTLTWRDSATPNKRGKPDGAYACKLCYKIGGPPPTGPSECTFAAFDSGSPYIMEFDEADAGKTVHWILCWVNAKFEEGPCSETLSATIPG